MKFDFHFDLIFENAEPGIGMKSQIFKLNFKLKIEPKNSSKNGISPMVAAFLGPKMDLKLGPN